MDQNIQWQFTRVPGARKGLALPAVAFSSIRSLDGKAICASSDTLFRGAIFGRDSLEVIEDLLETQPKLARNVLLTMGKLQGLRSNPENEEEPGKIIHEYRAVITDKKRIRGRQLEIFHELSERWGGNDKELAYYGSVDSTPLFLRVLWAYCERHNSKILAINVQQRDGRQRSLHDIAKKSVTWLLDKLSESRSGLLEYARQDPHGIENQAWKDSVEFYVHENGEQANHGSGIASIEVQGLAYDALIAAVHLFPQSSEYYESAAEKLRQRIFKLLWLENRNYFALGTDYATDGTLRIIKTKTANPAALLDTVIFDDMSDDERRQYITAIVRTIMSPDFLTNAGIRSRALSAGHLVNEWDYHGSYVSWPKETYDIAKGFRRQGMPLLAKQLENRILNIVAKLQEYPEFVYVDEWGQVLGGAPTVRQHGEVYDVPGSNTPERIQAWTVSAVIAIISKRVKEKVRRSNNRRDQWIELLESDIMKRIPRVHRYFLNPFKLSVVYPKQKYRLVHKK